MRPTGTMFLFENYVEFDRLVIGEIDFLERTYENQIKSSVGADDIIDTAFKPWMRMA